MTSANETNLIDGRQVAADIRREVKERVQSLSGTPRLTVVMVGDRRDSKTYVNMKRKACTECGIETSMVLFPEDVTELELLTKVRELNKDPNEYAILVQLPLPKHISEKNVIDCLDPKKDVDGLHPFNMGCLSLKGRTPYSPPCTAQGCVELCKAYGVELRGKEVVVLGRSNIVGMPTSLLMQQQDATVTMCHSQTLNIKSICQRADIIVAALGHADSVRGEWVKEGAVVIDVGINSVSDDSEKGYRLVGDVCFEEVKGKAKLITPVPGGVGPMTVAILMRNAVQCYERQVADRSVPAV